MRTNRLKGQGVSYYHCVSRVVDRRPIMGKAQKDQFCKIIRAVERYCGLQIITYVVMDNHFHILIRIPEADEVNDKELYARLGAAYPKDKVDDHRKMIMQYRKDGRDDLAEEYRQRFINQMGDVSQFMKMLKQRFSVWYNRQQNRVGTIWEDRFKSVLVEEGLALRTMAAYIDLNPVRARIVKDPKDYRWSGYGEASDGGEEARAGLTVAIHDPKNKSPESWKSVAARYRTSLFPQEQGTSGKKKGVTISDKKQVNAMLENKVKLSREELLRCRVRYFTDGAVIGSREFVEETFQKNRDLFSKKRNKGARPMKGSEQWGGLMTARALRLKPITASE